MSGKILPKHFDHDAAISKLRAQAVDEICQMSLSDGAIVHPPQRGY